MSRGPWTYLLHLRLNFQLMLAPIFIWGALAAGGRLNVRLVAAFLVLHICLYGGATAYNSAFDRDRGPVGGMASPPPVPPHLLQFSLALQMAGLVASLLFGPWFAATYVVMFLLGIAYSHPSVRLKARPWTSMALVALGQGGLGFIAGCCAAVPDPSAWAVETDRWRLAEAAAVAVLVPTALYPLSQVYQIEEDRERGDRTVAVAHGAETCFSLASVGVVVGGGLLTGYFGRHYSHAEALIVAGGTAAAGLWLVFWSRAWKPDQVLWNYTRFMWTGAGLSLALGGLFLWRLGRGD